MHLANRLKSFSHRQKVLFTVICVVLFRFGTHLPLPFINREFLKQMTGSGSFSFLDAMTGGGFGRLSFMALGITPYITASIVIQLLGVVFPHIEEVRRDGPHGQKQIEKITMIAGIGMGFLESLAIFAGYARKGVMSPGVWWSVLVCALLSAVGCACSIGLAHMITEYFFGNGMSILLLAGILAECPSDFLLFFKSVYSSHGKSEGLFLCVLWFLLIIGLCAFTYWLLKCVRKVRIVYSGKMSRDSYSSNVVSDIPVRLAAGGVLPVIFASSMLTIPQIIMTVSGSRFWLLRIFSSSEWLGGGPWWTNIGLVIYCVMVVLFGYFSNLLNLNPVEIADNLKKAGGTVPGIRPGSPTSRYLERVIYQTTFIGGVLLCVIAVCPFAAASVSGVSGIRFLGTSLVIIVSVIEDIHRDWKSASVMRRYSGFVRKGVVS